MAVALDFEICQASNCKSLIFTETTGAYSTQNTGGWNAPNELISSVTDAILSVTTPGGLTFDFDVLAQTPSFPTTDELLKYYITGTELGMVNSALTDGLYKFTYTVTTSTTTYTKIIYQLLYCNVKCCVASMLAKITDPDCDCQSDIIASASRAITLLDSLIYAAKCGNRTAFTNLLTILNKICRNQNCQTCG